MADFFLERASLYEATGINAKQLRFSKRLRSIKKIDFNAIKKLKQLP